MQWWDWIQYGIELHCGEWLDCRGKLVTLSLLIIVAAFISVPWSPLTYLNRTNSIVWVVYVIHATYFNETGRITELHSTRWNAWRVWDMGIACIIIPQPTYISTNINQYKMCNSIDILLIQFGQFSFPNNILQSVFFFFCCIYQQQTQLFWRIQLYSLKKTEF